MHEDFLHLAERVFARDLVPAPCGDYPLHRPGRAERGGGGRNRGVEGSQRVVAEDVVVESLRAVAVHDALNPHSWT